VVADLRMPGMTSIDLQADLKQRGRPLQFIIITAHGDVATARTAFQAQAIDFLEKPFDHTELIKAIETAFNAEQRRLDENRQSSADREKIAALTGREREVLQLAARGLHAKEIARDLGISPRTVEVHKARIMAKLGARNVAELVRLAVATGQDGN